MVRNGIAYDSHRFDVSSKSNTLILGGINIPYKYALLGHSDADVLLHAIADAILGAMALPDIGYWFPPTDDKFKNIDSSLILTKTLELLIENSYTINNIDSTIICEKPKILDYSIKIKNNIANILKVSPNQVGVKATTNEKMGFIGRGEGISCLAIATIS